MDDLTEKWIKEFNQKFTPHNPEIGTFGWSKQNMNGAEQIKFFISKQIKLAENRGYEKGRTEASKETLKEIIEKIEGMKNNTDMRRAEGMIYVRGFEFALAEIKTLIEKKLGKGNE